MSLSMPLLLAVGGTKMFNLPGILSLTWCVLGYMFLDRGDSTGAIIASMASLSMAWMATRADPPSVTDGLSDARPSPFH